MADDVSKWRHQVNRWGVGSSPDGKEIRVMALYASMESGSDAYVYFRNLITPGNPLKLSREHALELAAWIVAVAMPQDGEFEKILAYVRGEPIA